MTPKKKKKEVEEKDEKGITESFLGGIPILGNLFKELGKTETFKEKFRETDEKIKENLRKGHPKKWSFEGAISARPILQNIKKETSQVVIEDDYMYGTKGNKLMVAVKAPNKGVGFKIEGKNLLVTSAGFLKKIPLPGYYKHVKVKAYKKQILSLELTK